MRSHVKCYRPQLTGAAEIIDHLFEEYGPGKAKVPSSLRGGSFSLFKSGKGTNIRKNARPDNIRMRSITLYGWEDNSSVRQVREAMSELGLAHTMINCGDGSVNR